LKAFEGAFKPEDTMTRQKAARHSPRSRDLAEIVPQSQRYGFPVSSRRNT
jgi:hypothetical protein